MPTWLAIVLGAFVALVIILALGGIYARRRQLAAGEDRFKASLEEVNRQLAAAHAADRGWAREGLEAAAREAFFAQRGAEPAELTLVQIVDRPGTDEDKAVFRVSADGGEERLTLGRSNGDWVYETLA
jgi:hypothetical protein